MKKVLSITIALAMVMAMATTAFAYNGADNVNGDGTEVSEAGHKSEGSVGWGYTDDGSNDQTPGASYGQSLVTKDDNDDFIYADDDDSTPTANDNSADIYVWAKVSDADDSPIYKIDIEWGSMKFEFSRGTWDAENHEYGGDTVGWLEDNGEDENDPDYVGYLDGVNNRIDVTNHSNHGIDATFNYNNTYQFNAAPAASDEWNEDVVIGYFYGTKSGALAASKELTGTVDNYGLMFNITDGSAVNSVIEANLLKNEIWYDGFADWDETYGAIDLPTAWKYNKGDGYKNEVDEFGATLHEYSSFFDPANNVENGARTKSVYFAFSGTPDDDVAIANFTKVGVIQVTINANTGAELNNPYVTP